MLGNIHLELEVHALRQKGLFGNKLPWYGHENKQLWCVLSVFPVDVLFWQVVRLMTQIVLWVVCCVWAGRYLQICGGASWSVVCVSVLDRDVIRFDCLVGWACVSVFIG